ncbi:MAG TPA: hypothetical protein VGJ84_04320, partial [Polyangiaceae bacterium]
QGFWAGFRLGAGVDGNGLFSPKPYAYTYTAAGREVERKGSVLGLPIGSAHVGFCMAFGEFPQPTIWRGVVLAASYSPAYIGRFEFGGSGGAGGFVGKLNLAGFELSADVAKIEATVESKSQNHVRLAVLVLPKVNRDLPWVVSAGVGAVWY